MNSSVKKKFNLLTPEKAASLFPVLISTGIAILVIIFFVIPKYNKSNEIYLELNELVKKKNDLDNLKSSYKIINQKFVKLNKKKSRIIELIRGTSNLETFISTIGELGKKNNIQFISIVPKKIISSIDYNKNQNINENNTQSNILPDPLLVEGTKKYIIEFNFKAKFINLLSFLRELEFQENIILVDNINIKFVDEQIDKNQGQKLNVELIMTTYGKL